MSNLFQMWLLMLTISLAWGLAAKERGWRLALRLVFVPVFSVVIYYLIRHFSTA